MRHNRPISPFSHPSYGLLFLTVLIIGLTWTNRPAQAADTTPPTVRVLEGFNRVISLAAVPSRVAIGDPEIASVTVLKPNGTAGRGAGILLTGLKIGSTSLMVWPRNSAKAQRVTVRVIDQAANGFLSLSDSLKLNQDGSIQTLSGVVDDVGVYQQTRQSLLGDQADGMGDTGKFVDTVTLETSGTVQVDVKIVEFTRTELQNLGINLGRSAGSNQAFSYNITGPGSTTNSNFSSGSSATGTTVVATGSVANAFSLALGGMSGDITLALDILQSNGYARVLAEPSLIAQSGRTAAFLAGGEIPIPVPGSNGSIAIEYKKFGVGLSFRPTILSKDQIALEITPEVSDLDFSRGTSIQGILVPAILTRRATTTVELGEGQSFVIGGLISRSIISNSGKVPWLADLPILGAFFKEKSYRREDKELVITVTPRLVNPRSESATPLPMPGEDTGTNPGELWGQLLFSNADEPVPGFKH